MFERIMEINKKNNDIATIKIANLAKIANLTYSESHKIFIDYFRQSPKSIKNISLEEVLEFIDKENKCSKH